MLNPRPRELLLVWVVVVIELSVSGPLMQLAAQTKTGCTSSCGNLNISYPFGTKDGGNGCYYDSGESNSFVIFCDRSSDPPVPYWLSNESNILVDDISVDNHELRIKASVASDCYSSSGERTSWRKQWLTLDIFALSSTKNRLTVVGCDTYAFFTGQQDNRFSTGCISSCNSIDDVTEGSCLGVGCCQTGFPRNMRAVNISLGSYYNHTYIHDFNPCSFAFVSMNDYFNFSTAYLKNITEDTMPMILDWAIGDQTCEVAQKNTTSYMCKENTDCGGADSGKGYHCHCKKGYSGNPYLSGSDGCQDINECEHSNACNGICTNLPGSYNCSCPMGYSGDPWKDGCSPIQKEKKYTSPDIALVIVGAVAAAILFLLSVRWLCKSIKRRKKMKLRQKFFKQNGGLLLQQQLASPEANVEKSKLFNFKELERATNNFHENRILGQGGQGTVYKGMLTNGRIVAIKKSKMLYKGDVEQFINEVSILSRINHRNVVKLLGCCLETEVPLLVYEFIPNGTLYQYLHESNEEFQVPWDVRLRIASEVAGALFYLHSATSTPIYHRDIKTTNILLDEKYRAKIADFGTSRLVALDQTHVTTVVQGTFGYLDPEYFQSSQFTDKSDVYSFGVVLTELLTGQNPISSLRAQERIGLATYFILSVEEDRLFEILDARILNPVNREEIIAVANLARRCLYLNGRMRPAMKEVAMALESVRESSHPFDVQGIEERCWNFEIDGIKAHDVSFKSTGFEAGVPMSLTTDVYPLLSSDT